MNAEKPIILFMDDEERFSNQFVENLEKSLGIVCMH